MNSPPSVIELKAISVDWRGDSLADGDGLVGTVRVGDNDAISVHWRYAFKRDGRVAWHYCGTWPMTSVEAVRAARDEARGTLKRRVDPNVKREADRIAERERLVAAIASDARRCAEDATVEQIVIAPDRALPAQSRSTDRPIPEAARWMTERRRIRRRRLTVRLRPSLCESGS